MLGPSLTIPIVNGELTLGTWQQIMLLERGMMNEFMRARLTTELALPDMNAGANTRSVLRAAVLLLVALSSGCVLVGWKCRQAQKRGEVTALSSPW
jgi:hypothetical protein